MSYSPNAQLQDDFITGAAAQSTLGNNILLATAGAGGLDTVAPGANVTSYRAFSCDVIASAGISAGAIIFEGSNDNVNWHFTPYFWETNGATPPLVTALALGASSVSSFTGVINFRYLRCRISTAFVGGTVQAFTRLMVTPLPPRLISVTQGSAANLAAMTTPTTPSTNTITTAASTNATSVKASAATLFGVVLTNPTATPAYVKLYNKASAPTVGTDVPVAVFPVPANGDYVRDFGPLGLRFATGIALAVTGAQADSDASNAVAGVHSAVSYL